MATKGYKDNEQQAFTPTPTDWLGIQQGSLLSDMKKITYKDLTDPLQGQIDDHEQRVDDLELAEGSIKGVGWTGESLQSLDENKADKATTYTKTEVDVTIDALDTRLDTLEGTGEGSVAKAIDDAVSPLAEVVDTNRLYSDSQYLDLKAKYNAQQIALNASKAELYTDDPILQYGSTEIIGKGYEADNTPIDVSANVVDGKLSMEQKGLTITNMVVNGDFSGGTTGWSASGGTIEINANGDLTSHTNAIHNIAQALPSGYYEATANQVWYVSFRARVTNAECSRIYLAYQEYSDTTFKRTTDVNIKVTPTSNEWYTGTIRFVLSANTDFNKLVIRIIHSYASVAAGRVCEVDHKYGVSAYNLTALGLDHITDTDILAQLLPYVDGTKSVGKMGIQILDADDAVTQTIFLPAIGNSLPNGVADSIKTVADGWEHTKRVGEVDSTFTPAYSQDVWETVDGWDTLYAENGTLSVSSGYLRNTFSSSGAQYFRKMGLSIPADAMLVLKIRASKVRTVVISRWTGSAYNAISSVVANTDWSVFPIILPMSNERIFISSNGGVSGDTIDIDWIWVGGTGYVSGEGTAQDLGSTFSAINALAQLATPITTHYDLPLPTSGKTIHRFAGEEKIALYGTGLTFTENVLSVLSAVKFVAGVMTDITDLATITTNTLTFSGVSATDVVYVKVEHSVNRPLGILEHTPTVSNTASRLASLEARVSALEV